MITDYVFLSTKCHAVSSLAAKSWQLRLAADFKSADGDLQPEYFHVKM